MREHSTLITRAQAISHVEQVLAAGAEVVDIRYVWTSIGIDACRTWGEPAIWLPTKDLMLQRVLSIAREKLAPDAIKELTK